MGTIKNLKINMEQKILEANNVVIVPHNEIDFDAIGSAIGLSLIVQNMNKSSSIVVDDPIHKIDYGVQTVIEEAKQDFSIISRDKYLQIISPDDLFILTDVNKSYLVSLKNELTNPQNIIIIDHHNPDESTIIAQETYIDSNVSSASEIITNLLSLYNLNPTPKVANYLLAGIYLDTNKLTKNASSETMKIVAKLLEDGANMNIVTELFAEDFISDRRVQELVSKAKITNHSIATVCAEENAIYTKEELAKVADYLLKYKVDATFVIGKIGNGIIAISARSKEKIDVGSIMHELEGGGNQHSGATKLSNCTVKEAEKRLVKVLQSS